MHMADALLSPVVGGCFWVVSGALIGYSTKKIAQEKDISKTPLMGVMGAFIFAAQMINFTIPATGSSGHLGGGLLLAILLGPYRAFITLASILVIQCLIFADGGILALGCNIFNMAFLPSFIAYPLIYKKLVKNNPKSLRFATASIFAAEVGLLLGAFFVVLQTTVSGISELPFKTFALFMIPIHSAIGIVEGLVTWGVVSFVLKTEPALLVPDARNEIPKKIIAVFVVCTVITGGLFCLFASSKPDGLEWSIEKVIDNKNLSTNGSAHSLLASVQEKLSFLPDYSFRPDQGMINEDIDNGSVITLEKSISGIIGSIVVLILAMGIGFTLRGRIAKSHQKT